MAGIGLVFVIAWALLAVLLLSGTLLAAHNIRNDVAVINPRLTAINGNTGNVRLAAQTAQITGRIKAAAMPLSGQLSDTLTAAGQIKQSADKILGTAQKINGQVNSIHTTVFAIGSTVDSINGNVQAIGANVSSIGANVSSIGAHVQSISGSVNSVNAHVQSVNTSVNAIHASVQSIHSRALSIASKVGPINGRVVSILATVRSINPKLSTINTTAHKILSTARDPSTAAAPQVTPDSIVKEVNGINERARIVQSVATGIQSDLAAVLAAVGTSTTPGTIDFNANLIDCSLLFNATTAANPNFLLNLGALIPLGGPTTGCVGPRRTALALRAKSTAPAPGANIKSVAPAAKTTVPGFPVTIVSK